LVEDLEKVKECSICFDNLKKIYICPKCSFVCCFDCYKKNVESCDKCFICKYEWKVNYTKKMLDFIKKINIFSDFIKELN
jgi:hypothetical protein